MRLECPLSAKSGHSPQSDCRETFVQLFREFGGPERFAQSGSKCRLAIYAGQKTAVMKHWLQFQNTVPSSFRFLDSAKLRERRRQQNVGNAKTWAALDGFARVGGRLFVPAAVEFRN
jgi:hypothetical protein